MKHNILKRTLAGVLAILCVAGTLPANVDGGGLFDTAIVAKAEVMESGDCGATGHESDVEWSLDDGGTLTISGSGDMADYDSDYAPWDSWKSDIVTVVIEEGVTSIGFNAFWGASNLRTITIPEGVTKIGDKAFCDCTSLTAVTIPSTVTSIGACAFSYDNTAPQQTITLKPPTSSNTLEIGFEAFTDNAKVAFAEGNTKLFDGNTEIETDAAANTLNFKTLTWKADPVTYKAATVNETTHEVTFTDTECTDYIPVTDSTTTFEDGKWYVVNETLTNNNRITVNGTANLILMDGKTLTNAGITVNSGNTLNIYAQSAGTGELSAGNVSSAASIGGGARYQSGGTINIHGGKITATGEYAAAGIGGASQGGNGEVNIYGGNVTAQGSNFAAGIGGYSGKSGGTVSIYGGTVNASGSVNGVGIGIGGTEPGSCIVNIHGGDVTASSGKQSGIQGTVNIDGGTVTANGGTYDSGVHCYNGTTIACNGISGTVTISGGTVTATGANVTGEISNFGGNIYACDGIGGTVTINGGTVTATGGSHTGEFTNYSGTTVKEKGFGGSLTLGTGMIVQTSTDNSTWSAPTRDTTTRTQYMKVEAGTPAPTVTPPTAVPDLVYDTDEHALVNEGTPSEGAAMRYAVAGKIVENTDNMFLSVDDVKVGNIYTPTKTQGSSPLAIYFPENYSVKYGEKTYSPQSASYVGIYYDENYCIGEEAFEDGTNALMVTDIDTDNKVIKVKGVNTESGNGLDWVETIPKGTAAGEYTVFYKAVKDDESSAVGSVTATIAKGESSITTAPTAADDLTYDGTGQQLLATPGTSSDGTIEYALGTDTETAPTEGWSEDIPTATDAGIYPVYYRVKGDDNHSDSEAVKLGKVTVAKRAATITPDAKTVTYGDTSAPELTFSSTGVLEADEALFESTSPVAVKDYEAGQLNNAGTYDYEIANADTFANYELTIAENAPKFTVKPLDISKLSELTVKIIGGDGWTTDGNSGYYTYDGTTKAVEVEKVSKSGDTAATETFSASDLTKAEGANTYSKTSNGVTVSCTAKDTGSGEPMLVNSSNNITITVPTGAKFESVKLTVADVSKNSFTFNGKTYTPQTDNDSSKYVTIPESDITAASDSFTITSNENEIRIDKVTVNYTKTAEEYVLENGTDYTVGGMTKSATVGEKTVQVKGKGNYTGVAKAKWEIKPVENVESLVTFKINDDATWNENLKSYNWKYTGEPISCGAKFTEPDSDYAQEAEVTVKYTRFNNITGEYEEVDEAVHQGKYKVNVKVECDGYSPVEFNYDITISPKEISLKDTSFTINYGEDYSDHTDELLALFVEKGLLQSDADLIKQMLEDGTLIWYYDEGWLYPTWSEDVLKAAAEEAVKEDKDPEDWTVIESMIHKLYGDAVYQVANGNDNDIALVNPIIKPKSIKSDDVTVEFTNGNTVVLNEDGFVSESDIIVKDTGILNDDGEPTVLLADTDYELNIESTATSGEFTVEIVGKGNYKGVRIEKFKAMTPEEEAIADGIAIDLADAVLKDDAKARFVLTPTLADGWEVQSYGIVYDKNGAVTNAEEAKAGLVLDGSYTTKISKILDGTSYNLNITPVESNTIWAVGYITVTKNGRTATIYTEPKSGNVTEMLIDKNVKLGLADAVLKDGTKARFVLTPEIADGWTVDAYGIVYDKNGAIKDAKAAKEGLVLGGEYVTKVSKMTDGTSYNLNITPVDDNTIWAVGYITVTKDGFTKTIYTDPKSANVSDLRAPIEAEIEENVKITLADAVLKDGTKARFVLTPEIAEGWTVDAYGIVYDKTGVIETAEKAKTGLVVDGNFVTKISKMTDGTSYNLNITPVDDNTIWAVGYITATKDGVTKTIYTEPKSAKVSELVNN